MKPYGTNEQSEDRCVVVALRSNACRTFLTKSRLSALNYFNMYPESSEVEESLEKYFAPRKILDGNTRQLEKGCVTLQHFITHELRCVKCVNKLAAQESCPWAVFLLVQIVRILS